MSTSPSPNDLTRQQLDELDALLQRMLSLPLNNPPAAPPVPTPTEVPVPTGVSGAWRTDGPVSGGRSPYLASQSMPAVGQHGAIAPELDRPPPPEADWGPDPLARYNVDPARLFGPASHESGVMPSTVTTAPTTAPSPSRIGAALARIGVSPPSARASTNSSPLMVCPPSARADGKSSGSTGVRSGRKRRPGRRPGNAPLAQVRAGSTGRGMPRGKWPLWRYTFAQCGLMSAA